VPHFALADEPVEATRREPAEEGHGSKGVEDREALHDRHLIKKITNDVNEIGQVSGWNRRRARRGDPPVGTILALEREA
jgi:hypothetical protein